ncbi:MULTISPECIES: PPOX class F420-dependent oxidoreductase [Streptomyces]|uniref:PPOX class F420-dependent oxidoreductase n=1 Tax=Streptomyces silvisoli TaxID=3034235 RepID=A0ABT5ZMY9_9ACTN|nr:MULTISPECIES: PPOX class F420-dependent oxidoreductase [Streptomyces]MDF3291200.1 PPOX class F420-dependent oxidoreductase [Streptomyces silvisoli]
MVFTEAERAYLAGQGLGRLATVGRDGGPQVRPVGFRCNTDGTVDIGGPRLSSSQKWRNAQANPHVAFVVDDMTPDEPGAVKPGWGRGVEIRGRAELLTGVEPPLAPDFFSDEIIRVHPERVISWHINSGEFESRNLG